MMDSTQDKLRTLRNVASQHNWKYCREAAKNLFIEIEQIHILQLLLHYTEVFLSSLAVSDYKNNEDFLMVKAISTKISVDNFRGERENLESIEVLIGLLENKTDTPGLSNFVNSLHRLLTLKLDYPLETYIKISIDILSGIFMAILVYQWGKNNVELWRNVGQDIHILRKHFWNSAETITRDTELWTELADRIEGSLIA